MDHPQLQNSSPVCTETTWLMSLNLPNNKQLARKRILFWVSQMDTRYGGSKKITAIYALDVSSLERGGGGSFGFVRWVGGLYLMQHWLNAECVDWMLSYVQCWCSYINLSIWRHMVFHQTFGAFGICFDKYMYGMSWELFIGFDFINRAEQISQLI